MVLPKNRTQCPRPGLEPGALAPELSALTMRPPAPTEFWKTTTSKWHLNPYQTTNKMFNRKRKTKWTKKILVIPFTTLPVLIAARVTLAKHRENSQQEKVNTKMLLHSDKAKHRHARRARVIFCEVSEIGAFMELFTVMIWLT